MRDAVAILDPRPHGAARAFERTLRLGLVLAAGIVFGLGGLAATLPITGAVVASGEVAVASRVKHVAHPSGGVIAQLRVHDGDHVRAGQILLRLDSTISGATAALSSGGVDQLLAREARLVAERDLASSITFPVALTTRATVPSVAGLMREERRLMALHADARRGQGAQLVQRVRQSEAEIAGYRAQRQAIERQAGFLQQELSGARELWQKRYTTLQRLNALERTAAGLAGDAAALQTQEAQSRARIAEVRQQMIALDEDARSRAGSELGDVRAKLDEYRQRKIAADDVNQRNVIRAPQAGVVDKLAYVTVGGVVPAGATILDIVPDADRLVVRARIRPADVDQVAAGQTARLRFTAFNLRTTPEIDGRIARVSADIVADARTGSGFYDAEILLSAAELRRLDGLVLRPGMPVEAFVATRPRTMLGYIAKPLADQARRAFRER